MPVDSSPGPRGPNEELVEQLMAQLQGLMIAQQQAQARFEEEREGLLRIIRDLQQEKDHVRELARDPVRAPSSPGHSGQTVRGPPTPVTQPVFEGSDMAADESAVETDSDATISDLAVGPECTLCPCPHRCHVGKGKVYHSCRPGHECVPRVPAPNYG